MMKCVATIDPAHFSVDSDEVSDVENLWLIFFSVVCCTYIPILFVVNYIA